MRLLIAVVLLLAGVASAERALGAAQALVPPEAAAEIKLTKPVILNPLEKPEAANTLAALANIMAKEPKIASGTKKAFEDDDDLLATKDDLKLLSDEPCAEKGDCKSGAEGDVTASESAEVEAATGAESGAAGSASAAAGEGSAEAAADSKETEIASLEKLIKNAMAISQQIPEKLKRLKELKKEEAEVTEENARKEAEKTLGDHKKLLGELSTQIEKLTAKLEALKAKRDALTKSDKTLEGELKADKEAGEGKGMSLSS